MRIKALTRIQAWVAWVALLAAAASPSAWAQANSIEAVSVSPQAAGTIIVRVTLKDAPANPPAGFTVNNPPRIAFDFANTTNALGRSVEEVGGGDLRRINVVQSGGRTRMVLELSRTLGYDARVDGKSVLITLQGAAAAAGAASPGLTQQLAEARAGDQKHGLRNIDFRRGNAGEGRVIVDLSDNNIGIDLRRQGSSIIVDFVNTQLPRNLERRLDVSDFDTPVRMVDAVSQGNNARLIITPRGSWEHSAYQTDNRFVIDVKRIVDDPNRLVQGSRAGCQL